MEVWWKQAGSESGNGVEKGPKVELCWKHGGSKVEVDGNRVEGSGPNQPP